MVQTKPSVTPDDANTARTKTRRVDWESIASILLIAGGSGLARIWGWKAAWITLLVLVGVLIFARILWLTGVLVRDRGIVGLGSYLYEKCFRVILYGRSSK
jgi:hypothetical protein